MTIPKTQIPAFGDNGALQRIVRKPQLKAVTGYNDTYVYELIAAGEFPKPIKLGARAVGWLESDLIEWQRQRIVARDQKAAEEKRSREGAAAPSRP